MKQTEGAFTKIPNIILDDTTLNVYERAILIHVARQTIGYGKKSDGISLSQFGKATGISKNKVIRTIADLNKKKQLKVTKQTSANGGKSYNRYSLTLVLHKDYLVADKDYPSTSQRQGLVLHKDIQKKIEQKKIDKRDERENIPNVFYSLSEHEKKREANLYAEYASVEARSPTSYKIKIKKQIDKQHKQTLEAFEEWYFKKVCEALNKKYRGEKAGEYMIRGIYPYTDTKGYDQATEYKPEGIFFAGAMNMMGETKVWSAESIEELDNVLELECGSSI